MKRRTAFLAFITFLSAACPLSAAGGNGVLSLSGGPVFATDTPQVKATLSIPVKEKAKVEFNWVEPSGRVYSNNIKILYPPKNKTEASINDHIKIAGEPASGKPGWWRAEAVINGEILSKKFFLTDNRQVISFFGGAGEEKIKVLEQFDLSGHGAREIIDAAFREADERVRVSAVGALKGVRDGWAVEALEKCMDDPVPAVRAEAFAALLSRGGVTALKAAEKASADSSPEIRALAAKDSASPLGQKGSKVMGTLLLDKYPAVRAAALSALAAADGNWVIETLAGGMKADDTAFRKRVLNVILFKKGEKAGALSEGLKDAEPAIRAASLGYLIEKNLAAPGAVRPLVSDPVYDIAEAALKELGRQGDHEGLRAALNSPHAGIRLQAVKLLSADPAGNAPALAVAVGNPDLEIRKTAVAALAKSGRAGVPGLLAALDDADEAVRSDAAYAIERARPKEAEGRMLAALSDASSRVRLHSLKYFISLGGPGLPEVLGKAACDESADVRAEALARLVDMPGEEASGALSAFLACGDRNTKNTVVDSLAARRDASARAVLTSSLKDADAGIRFKAASGLLSAGVAVPFSSLLDDPDPSIRKIALAAVQASPDPALLPALERLSKDADPDIRFAVVEVLKGIKGDAPAVIIASMSDDADPEVRLRARERLFSRPEISAMDALLSIAVSGEGEERKKAAEAISTVTGPQAEEALLQLLFRGGPEQRIFALDKISGRKSPLLKEAVSFALKDTDEKVRLTAAERIGGLPPDEAYQVYTEAASSPYPEVRRIAVFGLKGNRDNRSVEIFLKALDEPAPDVKREALKALQTAGNTGFAEKLPYLILDPDPELRRAAFGAALSLPDRKLKADALVAAAGGSYPDLSQVAATALVPLGDPRAVPYFVRFFAEGYSSGEMLDGIINVRGGEALSGLEKTFSLSSQSESRKLKIMGSLDGRGPAAIRLLDMALKDTSPGVRQEAARILAGRWKEGGEEWEAALGQAVRHGDFTVRKTALDAVLKAGAPVLVKYGVPALSDNELLDEVLSGLKERPEPEVLTAVFEHAKGLGDAAARARAVRFLNEKGYDVLAMADAFFEGPDKKVRAGIIKRLAGAKGPDAVFRLARTGGKEEGTQRLEAWKGIRGRSSDEILRGMDLLLADGKAAPGGAAFFSENLDDPELLKQLVLKTAKNPEAFKPALRPMIERHAAFDAGALVEAIGLPDKETGVLAESALTLVPGEEGDTALLEAFRRYPASRVALLKPVYGPTRIKKLLPPALRDKDAAVRLEAARSLKDVSGPGTEDIVLLGLSCPEEQIRLIAAEAAAAGNLRQPLLRASADPSPAVRARAALGLRNFPGGIPVLKTLALDREAGVSGAALDSLGPLEEKVPSSVWAEIALETDRKEAKLLALEILIARQDPSQAKLFSSLLGDRYAEVSAKAEEGLMALGVRALPEVHPLLRKKKLVQAALRIIIKAADRSSEPVILDVLSGLEDDTLPAALKALEKTGGDASLAHLSGLYRKGDFAVKVAAVKALRGLRISGKPGIAVETLSDAISSKKDNMRFYAAQAIGNLRPESLRDALSKAAGSEVSAIVRAEMETALERFNGAGSGKAPTGL